MIILISFIMGPQDILRFAHQLEREGDTFRAITEYKRYLYINPDADSIRYRIVNLYIREGLLGNAVDIMREAVSKNENYNNIMGFLFYRMGIYDSVPNYWKDKKLGLLDLQREEYKKGLKRLGLDGIKVPSFKSPLVGALLSAVVPGLGRVYSGRTADGIFAFLTCATTSYFAYHYYKRDEKLQAYASLGLSLFFYAGDIFGSYLSVNIYNDRHKKDFIEEIEEEVIP